MSCFLPASSLTHKNWKSRVPCRCERINQSTPAIYTEKFIAAENMRSNLLFASMIQWVQGLLTHKYNHIGGQSDVTNPDARKNKQGQITTRHSCLTQATKSILWKKQCTELCLQVHCLHRACTTSDAGSNAHGTTRPSQSHTHMWNLRFLLPSQHWRYCQHLKDVLLHVHAHCLGKLSCPVCIINSLRIASHETNKPEDTPVSLTAGFTQCRVERKCRTQSWLLNTGQRLIKHVISNTGPRAVPWSHINSSGSVMLPRILCTDVTIVQKYTNIYCRGAGHPRKKYCTAVKLEHGGAAVSNFAN